MARFVCVWGHRRTLLERVINICPKWKRPLIRKIYCVQFSDYWESHPEIEKVRWIQAKSDETNIVGGDKDAFSDISDSEAPTSSGDHRGKSDEDSEEEEDEDSVSEGEASAYAHNKFAALADDDWIGFIYIYLMFKTTC